MSRFLPGVPLLLLLAGLLVHPASPADRAIPAQTEPPAAAETEPGVIHPGPADQAEEIGLWVFLGWMWGAIAVLAAVLLLKIKEADRLHALRYFDSPRGKRFMDP